MEKLLIAGVLFMGAFFYHFSEVHKANEKGKQEIQSLWDQDKAARQAIVDQKLKEKEADEEVLRQAFLEANKHWEAKNEEINAQYLAASADLERMRKQLKTASTRRNGMPLDPGSTCTAHAARLDQIATLLREGTELHVEGIQYLRQLGLTIDELQELIRRVQQTNR